ncbi:MAG: alpha/beta hydrolase [Bacteroidia bacterium]|nr:alpha/beta hydrolase [Bacteroidia bacterium]
MLKGELKVEKNARYFVLGSESKSIKKVWLVFHGYGQLANFFIKNFEQIDDGETLIIAPEGLNRFYWKGFSDKVVASWMTKEDRGKDIEDYVNYLNVLWDSIQKEYKIDTASITLFAYSQGTATLCRWLLQNNIQPKNMVFWAGTLAHDIDFELLKSKLSGTKAVQLFGDKDEFYKPEQLKKLKEFIDKKELEIDFKIFDGGHELKSEIIQELHSS